MTRGLSLHRALPRHEPARAALRTRALGLFNTREIGGLCLMARLADARERDAAKGWVRFDAGGTPIAMAPLIADGMLARITGEAAKPDGAIAAALLGRMEPLIAAIETLLDRPLAPAGLAETAERDWLTLRIDATPPGGPLQHRLLLALPDGLSLDHAAMPRPAPALLRRIRLGWRGVIQGPRVTRHRLVTVGRGDLLLLGLGPLAARLSLPGHAGPAEARIDLTRREAVLLSNAELEKRMTGTWDETAMAHPAPEDGTAAGAAALADLPVPIRVEFDGGAIPAGQLAALTEGAILPLPVTGETLPVRLLAGDTVWALGTLVAVGDGYGVLIDAILTEAK